MKQTFIILSEKNWNKDLIKNLSVICEANFVLIDKKQDFTLENLQRINPAKIFIPHWSYIIPSEIYENFECVVFHMTDLPFGRGGSPLQNLIVRGFEQTKISALRVEKGLDMGDIYLKKELSLLGTGEEIFLRASTIIESMIKEIINNNLQCQEQIGEITVFQRRKPEQSNLENLDELKQIYDYIRMLDAEGYPKAFLETEHFRFEFSRASLKSDNSIIADVKIIPK